jgi:hypothetical protein
MSPGGNIRTKLEHLFGDCSKEALNFFLQFEVQVSAEFRLLVCLRAEGPTRL